MSILRRMSDVFQQKVSAAVDKAEDPSQALDLSYQKQLEALQQARRSLPHVLPPENRLYLQPEPTRALGTGGRTAAWGGTGRTTRAAGWRRAAPRWGRGSPGVCWTARAQGGGTTSTASSARAAETRRCRRSSTR